MKKISMISIFLLCLLFFLQGEAGAAGPVMRVVQGGDQQVRVGENAASPVVLKVVDDAGKPVKTRVLFKLVKGEGRLSRTQADTDASGQVSFLFTAGYSAGPVVVEASIPGKVHVTRSINLAVTYGKERETPAKAPAPAVKAAEVKKPEPKPEAKPEPVKAPVAVAPLKTVDSKVPILERIHEEAPKPPAVEKEKEKAKPAPAPSPAPKAAPEKPAAVKFKVPPAPKKPPHVMKPGVVPSRIVSFSGNRQKVKSGQKAPSRLEVQVMDAQGNILPEIYVDFKMLEGEGYPDPPWAVTDKKGIASVSFVAGLLEGPAVVKASVEGSASVSTTFRLQMEKGHERVAAAAPDIRTAPAPVHTPPAPVKPEKTPAPVKPEAAAAPAPRAADREASIIIGFGGNNQTIKPGQVAGKKLEVQILDGDGKPIPGTEVSFEVIQGDGSCMPAKAATDSSGIASVMFRAGEKEGPISVKASLGGKGDLSTIFNLVAGKDEPATASKPVSTADRGVRLTPVPSPAKTPDAGPGPSIDVKNLSYPDRAVKPRGYYSRKPTRLAVVGGNYQASPPGVRLPQPLVIFVSDDDGNPVEASVQFTIIGGDARVTNEQVRTDDRGLASTFVVVNSSSGVKILAEVLDSPGLSTIAYANMSQPGSDRGDSSPIIKSTLPTNQPGFPAAIAFYSLRSQNTDNIEKTGVVQLEIGVSDFRNQPVATTIKFSVIKGRVSILNPIVTTNSQGRGIAYVDLGSSMGIFSIEAQSMENPDLKAVFKAGPTIQSGPPSRAVRPGLDTTPPREEESSVDNPSEPPPLSVPPPVADSGVPSLIAVVGGGGQSGKAGSRLAEPLQVLITDARGMPVEGAMVSFIVFRGKADLEKSFAKTDKDGKVTNFVTLGSRPGPVEIAVRVRDNKKLRTTVKLNAE